MRRPVFSFRPNLELEDHRQAWQILKSVPEGRKNRFLVNAILQEAQMNRLEEVVRRTVREELQNIDVQVDQKKSSSEIPNQMLDFLEQMEG